MRLILNTTILNDANKSAFAVLRKEFETNLVPVPGMGIHDSAWSDPVEIKAVTINLNEEEYYWVTVDDEHCSDEKECQLKVNKYIANNWRMFPEAV